MLSGRRRAWSFPGSLISPAFALRVLSAALVSEQQLGWISWLSISGPLNDDVLIQPQLPGAVNVGIRAEPCTRGHRPTCPPGSPEDRPTTPPSSGVAPVLMGNGTELKCSKPREW